MKGKMTVQEYFDLVKQSKKRKSKYKNKKKQLDGYVFDSQLEADYYLYLTKFPIEVSHFYKWEMNIG